MANNKESLSIEQQKLKVEKDLKEAIEAANKAREEGKITAEQLLALEKDLNSEADKLQAKLDNQALAYEQRVTAAKEAHDLAQQELNLLKQTDDIDKARIDKLQRRYEIEDAEIKVLKRQLELDRASGKLTEAELLAQEEYIANQELSLDYRKKANAEGEALAKTLFGVEDIQGSILHSVFMTAEGVENIGEGFKNAMQPANIMGSIVMKVAQSTAMAVFTFDEATTQLAATTGAGGEYTEQVSDLAAANRSMGMGFGEAAKQLQGLHMGMKAFTGLTKEQQNELAKTSNMLSRFGITAETTGQSMDHLMLGMGMTVEQATDIQKDMAKAAIAIGMPPEAMAQGFQQAMPQLAKFGKEAPKIFKKLAAASKKLGVSMDTMLSIAEGMDTFEGAATAAGKLNSILGGDLLNSYDLLNASAEEKNRMILQAVDSSGKSWQAMNRFEKQAIANAAGIQDMSEANKMFEGGLSAYDSAQEQLENTAVSEEELAERAQATISIKEKLTQVMEMFAVAVAPLVSLITSLVGAILWFNDVTGGWLIPLVFGIAMGYFIWYRATLMLTAIQKAKVAADLASIPVTASKAAAEEAGAIATTKQGAAAAFATGPMATFLGVLASFAPIVIPLAFAIGAVALAIGLVAVSVAAAIWAVVYLMKLFMEMPAMIIPAIAGLLAFAGAIYLITYMFAGLAPIAGLAMYAMMMIGTGLMYLAVPLVIAAVGFAIFGAAMKLWDAKTFAVMGGIALVLPLFAASLLAAAVPMAVAAGFIGPASVQLGIGFAVLAVGLFLLTFAIPAMIAASFALPLFANAMLMAAAPMLVAAYPIALASMLMGQGFITLAAGLFLLTFAIPGMLLTAMALPIFANAMFAAAVPMLLAAPMIGPAAGIMGTGFTSLAIGLFLLTFAIPGMLLVALALPIFANAMFAAAVPMLIAAPMIGPAATLLGVGFSWLALGLFLMSFAIPSMWLVALALPFFAAAMIKSAVPLNVAAGFITPALIFLGAGFAVFALGMWMMADAIVPMLLTALVLPLFAMAMIKSAAPLNVAAAFITPALIFLGIGFGIFGLGLQQMEGMWKVMALVAVTLPFFALALFYMTPYLWAAAFAFVPAAAMLGVAFILLGFGLQLMAGMAPTMAYVAVVLPLFGLALKYSTKIFSGTAKKLAIAVGMIGLAFIALGLGLQQMVGMVPTMFYVTFALIPFAFALGIASKFLSTVGFQFAISGIAVGIGLFAIGMALQKFPLAMIALMIPLGIGLVALAAGAGVFGIIMQSMAVPFLIGAIATGLGLAAIGWGLSQWNPVWTLLLIPLAVSLLGFAVLMIPAAFAMIFSGALLMIAAPMMAVGLRMLAWGLEPWMSWDFEKLATFGATLDQATNGLLRTAFWLLFSGPMMLIGGTMMGLGLRALAFGLEPFMSWDFEKLATFGATLDKATDHLTSTAFWLLFSGPMMLIGGTLMGLGLRVLAWGIEPFMAMDFAKLATLGMTLMLMSTGLFTAGVKMAIAGIPFIIGATLVAIGMSILAGPLMRFALAMAVIAPFAGALPAIAAGLLLLGLALPAFGFGLFMLGIAASLPFFDTGMEVFVDALNAMATAFATIPTEKAVALGQIFQGMTNMTDLEGAGEAISEFASGIFQISFALMFLPIGAALVLGIMLNQIFSALAPVATLLPTIAIGLIMMGEALPTFAWGITALGFAAAMPFFSTGLSTFVSGIKMFTSAIGSVETEKAQAFAEIFSSMTALTELEGMGGLLWELGFGILFMAWALNQIPEAKTMALGYTLESLTQAAVQVTPEAVENVVGVVEQAAAYSQVQAEFRKPSVDAFVQALVQVKEIESGKQAAAGGKKGGKEIVLVLNGRELGRAVDVHLDDKHDVRTS